MSSPILDRSSVAGEAFLSDDIYGLELDRLFASMWTIVATEEEVAEPFSYVTSWLAGDPIIVARQPDGSIRVLLNFCRHRGRPLARGRGVAEEFRCRHQGWTYSSEGSLMSVPDAVGPGRHFDFADWGLVSTSEVVANDGFVYARWTPSPQQRRQPEVSGTASHRVRSSIDIASNWKCAVETALVDAGERTHWLTLNSAYLADRDAVVVLQPSGVATTKVLVFDREEDAARTIAREFKWTIRHPATAPEVEAGGVVCANTGQVCETASSAEGCALAVEATDGFVPRRSVAQESLTFYRAWRTALGEVAGFDADSDAVDDVRVSVRSASR